MNGSATVELGVGWILVFLRQGLICISGIKDGRQDGETQRPTLGARSFDHKVLDDLEVRNEPTHAQERPGRSQRASYVRISGVTAKNPGMSK